MRSLLLLTLLMVLPANVWAQVMSDAQVTPAQSYERNFILNPSAFKGTANSATSSAAVARDTDAADKIDGIASWTCDASAQNGYCEFTLGTITAPDDSGNCTAEGYYKGDASLYKAQILDGSANVLSSTAVLSSVTAWTIFQVSYPCGSSRKVRFAQTEAGTAPAVNLGRLFYGRSATYQISQSRHVGSADFLGATSCQWTGAGATTDFPADTDCNFPTVTGSLAALGTKKPGFQLQNAVAGRTYFIAVTGPFRATNVSGVLRLYDGTTSTNATYIGDNDGNTWWWPDAGTFAYTPASSGNKDLVIQGPSNLLIDNQGTTTNLRFDVFSYPSAADAIPRPEDLNWRVDANISGAHPSLGTSAVTTYSSIEHGSLTLSNATGNGIIAAQIPCATGTSPSGTTCSAANEAVGVSFTVPRAGDVIACASFAHSSATAASGAVQTYFQIAETAAGNTTITQEGKSRIGSGANVASIAVITPARVCGTFTFASAGQKVLRLMYEQTVTATVSSSLILADAGANEGQRDIHWEVYPINAGYPAPVFVGSVTSGSSGAERIERAELNCDAASSITAQSGSWLSAIGNRSTAACSVTIATGIFSATPACTFTAKAATVQATSVSMSSATAGTVYGASADYDGYLICMGSR